MPFHAADELAPPLDAPLPEALARPRIAVLPEAEAAKIKAGEVVERPANIVKELVENALDAGATRISVELEDGGKQSLRVTDNGGGIPADELPLAVQRHATSKIRRLDDLYALSTLGFRGEGLAAIGAVSRLSLASRAAGAALGARLRVDGGAPGAAEALTLQPGTVAEVRDLFYNVPARLKFLRSAQAETSQVAALLTGYALAYPEVRWLLSSGGRVLLRSDGDGDGLAVLADLCDLPAAPAASPFARIDFEFPPSAVRGWVSEPRYHRHNRARQWFFVNRRPVSNKLLYRAVDDAVREFMSQGKFPQGAFFLELAPEEIDVNVHPMKLEVSFAQPQAVYSLVTTAVRRALGGAAAARQRQLSGGLAAAITPLKRNEAPPAPPARPTTANLGWAEPEIDLLLPETDSLPPGQQSVPVFRMEEQLVVERAATPEPPSAVGGGPWSAAAQTPPLPPVMPQARAADPGLRTADLSQAPPQVTAIQQVANSYLALLTPDAVYLVDQHAAHERILFETLYERLQAGPELPAPARQRLLFPLALRLSPAEAQLAADYAAALSQLGFTAAWDAAARALEVGEVPVLLAGRVTAELLHGALAELAEAGRSALIEEQGKRLAASLACRAAIKAGDALPREEQRELVRQLLSRWSSLSCPHGRPTILRLGTGELEGLFLR
jgi:DNA mismatch repair protein MutL